MKAKILIVGGGVMGTSIALKAAQRTEDPLAAPVVLLERDQIGSGSSGRSGAILRTQYSDREVAVMARDSLREYAGFKVRTGRTLGFQQCGVLTLAGPGEPEWADVLRRNVAMLRELGIDTEIVEGAGLAELVPGMTVRAGSVGAWEPGGGFVDPGQTVQAFAALARDHGATTRLGTEVTELLLGDGRVQGARTRDGVEYRCEKLVLVAGPWSAGLLARAGLEFPLKTVRPENHYVALPDIDVETRPGPTQTFPLEDLQVLSGEDEAAAPAAPHPVLIDLEHSSYVRCDPGHARTRVGRTEYHHDHVLEDPDTLSEEATPEEHAWARAALEARLPTYADHPDAGCIAAWYTLTPDAQALIGPVPSIEGMFVVTGFSGHGFKLAPSVGEGVAQMLFDRPVTAFDPEFFAPTRFRGGESWGGRFGL